MQGLPEISPFITLVEDDILSPESYVFVALMSIEEGPNKATFLRMSRANVTELSEALSSAE
jgi:hypothetical protein